jgi:hypothetical protein
MKDAAETQPAATSPTLFAFVMGAYAAVVLVLVLKGVMDRVDRKIDAGIRKHRRDEEPHNRAGYSTGPPAMARSRVQESLEASE